MENSRKDILINGYVLNIGEKYSTLRRQYDKEISAFSKLDRDGNAFIIIENVVLFEINGQATFFFHRGLLDNVVLTPNWENYNLFKQNGERMHIDEATYLIYKKCHDFLVENFGSKVNDDYIPEIYKISQHLFAALYMSSSRDNVSLVLRENYDI